MDTLLIANRGEIVIRVARTARELGIRTVAVYSDADRDAPHVRACDEAVHLGATPATESYLNVERVIEAARRVGADAVHPGYGFLSERSEFARAVVAAGLTFVGPTADVMDRMGRKDHARDIAVAAGVPVVPSFTVDSVTPADFPVLVKAAAGGGGKGMRVVHDPAVLAESIEAAKREAASAFGDDTILIERYVARGRHIEVQVLADEHGNVVHLYERDCSLQRRHQKVLEEAPAATIAPEVREVLTTSAVALAREVGYTNAGTVEFLVDTERGTDGVYFLEMNTRLQVEHPVTEAVTGLDLVALQLRIADGEPLGFSQDDVTCTGHAIEARIYAEDAFGGFLPQAGTATVVRWSDRARNDHALESDQVVSSSYDPMLGKVIVHAADRPAAIDRLVEALDETVILGLVTNTGFVRQLADSEAFSKSEIDTAWLDRHADRITRPEEDVAVLFAASAVAAVGQPRDPGHPFGVGDGWRAGGEPAPVHVDLARDGKVEHWQVHGDRVVGRGRAQPVHVLDATDHVLTLEIDGAVRSAVARVTPQRVEVSWLGTTHAYDRPDDRDASGSAAVSDGALLAQMPGTVLAVHVAQGDRVEEGQVLGVLEAMKMELALRAPFAGEVARVGAAAGDQVHLKQLLFQVEANDE